MSRVFIVASHAHFAGGICESVQLLAGEQSNVHVINAFVDGANDIAEQAQNAIQAAQANVPEADLVVLTDLMGGSVNTEFTKLMLAHPEIHVVTNMNLPLLLSLLLADESQPTAELIREVTSDAAIAPQYINDTLASDSADNSVDEDF